MTKNVFSLIVLLLPIIGLSQPSQALPRRQIPPQCITTMYDFKDRALTDEGLHLIGVRELPEGRKIWLVKPQDWLENRIEHEPFPPSWLSEAIDEGLKDFANADAFFKAHRWLGGDVFRSTKNTIEIIKRDDFILNPKMRAYLKEFGFEFSFKDVKLPQGKVRALYLSGLPNAQEFEFRRHQYNETHPKEPVVTGVTSDSRVTNISESTWIRQFLEHRLLPSAEPDLSQNELFPFGHDQAFHLPGVPFLPPEVVDSYHKIGAFLNKWHQRSENSANPEDLQMSQRLRRFLKYWALRFENIVSVQIPNRIFNHETQNLAEDYRLLAFPLDFVREPGGTDEFTEMRHFLAPWPEALAEFEESIVPLAKKNYTSAARKMIKRFSD